jgi:hypothetical protein
MKSILFVTAPWTDTQMPLMAPAILKSVAEQAGYVATVYELNAEIAELIKGHKNKNSIIEFFFNGLVKPEVEQEIFELIELKAQQIVNRDCDIVAFSVFTYSSQISTKWLCYLIKKLNPDIKILIGGAGILDNLTGSGHYAEDLLRTGLIDHYIRGDGEHALINYLNGNAEYPGVDSNQWKELSNNELESLPMPNYDDYDWSKYELKALPILGSRGCVRQCTFCDIHAHWNKFTWRSGKNIFDEMIMLSKKYNIYHFKFQDSLINGNMKEYRQLVTLLADYNSTAKNPISWNSFFIFRPAAHFKERDWELTALSGAKQLLVGVESLSEHVRNHMGKKFSNADIEYSLEQAHRLGIKLGLLMIVGYVTETETDIQFAEQWWKEHQHYADNTIDFVNLGGTLGILKNTPLEKNFIPLNLVRTGPNDQDWVNPAINSTPKQRAEWSMRIRRVLQECGYKEYQSVSDNHLVMEQLMKRDSQWINSINQI